MHGYRDHHHQQQHNHHHVAVVEMDHLLTPFELTYPLTHSLQWSSLVRSAFWCVVFHYEFKAVNLNTKM
jgi:hypothetical protein